ncbi:BrnT family toxin [Rhodococcus sp. WS4]|nr:BrnT family toxin [Rhodococcus sp. WS4]
MSGFEFDPNKSEANLAKHGIDFLSAQALWRDPHRLEVPARTTDEPRWLVIGLIDGKWWSAVVTYRADRIRIISVRRSREGEVALYES